MAGVLAGDYKDREQQQNNNNNNNNKRLCRLDSPAFGFSVTQSVCKVNGV